MAEEVEIDLNNPSPSPTSEIGLNSSGQDGQSTNLTNGWGFMKHTSSKINGNCRLPFTRQSSTPASSLVDGLLFDIYDRWLHHRYRDSSFESDTLTEASTGFGSGGGSGGSFVRDRRRCSTAYSTCSDQGRRYTDAALRGKSLAELKRIAEDLQHRSGVISSRLVRQLKRRDHRLVRLQKNCDVVTAILQAQSQKRRVDARLKFTVEPKPGDEAFRQWKDAMKAVARLPMGLPSEFRKKVWLSLAENYIRSQRLDWDRVKRLVFNERPNPDDDALGLQIVKDLHRTGCDRFCSEADQAVLKRVLLAYARWNKRVGYCQGFNVLAALILEVLERNEEAALKVMLYLVDCVLPESYFAENLQALSVDMAVFRELLRSHLPELAQHLERLQRRAAEDDLPANAIAVASSLASQQPAGSTCGSGAYEPPLTNVFTMQWFLTLFATCLPLDATLRVWDAVLLEGSEVMLRTALVLWEQLSERVRKATSADQFYALMGQLSAQLADEEIIGAEELMKRVYNLARFPFPGLQQLREKYTYNITPFSGIGDSCAVDDLEDDVEEFVTNENGSRRSVGSGGGHQGSGTGHRCPMGRGRGRGQVVDSLGCFSGIWAAAGGKQESGSTGGLSRTSSSADIGSLGPGAVTGPGAGSAGGEQTGSAADAERRNTNLNTLQAQYRRLRQRQKQASLVIHCAGGGTAAPAPGSVGRPPAQHNGVAVPVVNHLFLGKRMAGRRRKSGSSIGSQNETKRDTKDEDEESSSGGSSIMVVSSCSTATSTATGGAEADHEDLEDEEGDSGTPTPGSPRVQTPEEEAEPATLLQKAAVSRPSPDCKLDLEEALERNLDRERTVKPTTPLTPIPPASVSLPPSPPPSPAPAPARPIHKPLNIHSPITASNPFPPNPRLMSSHRKNFGSKFGLYNSQSSSMNGGTSRNGRVGTEINGAPRVIPAAQN